MAAKLWVLGCKGSSKLEMGAGFRGRPGAAMDRHCASVEYFATDSYEALDETAGVLTPVERDYLAIYTQRFFVLTYCKLHII
jgi:hypothetical protein